VVVQIGTVIEKMLKKMGIETPVRQWEAVYLWESVVGEAIANHTRADKVAYGKLYISVDSPSWRNELLFHRKELLEKINKELKNTEIKEIILR